VSLGTVQQTAINDISTYVTAADISPFPKTLERKSRGKSRACGAATVLTSTPHKQHLEEFQMKSPKVQKQRIVKGGARRALGLPNVSTRQTDDGASSAKKTSRKKSKKKSSAGVSEDLTPCGTCSVTFASDVQKKTGRRWVMCCKCNCWYHNEC